VTRLTVESLLEATARVLMARGCSGTTTNHVARRAGVSVGSLYEYFPGKEALGAALVERHLEDAEARLDRRSLIDGSSAPTRVRCPERGCRRNSSASSWDTCGVLPEKATPLD